MLTNNEPAVQYNLWSKVNQPSKPVRLVEIPTHKLLSDKMCCEIANQPSHGSLVQLVDMPLQPAG